MAVLVDEYDSFLNSVFGNKEFAHDPEELKKMEFTFAAFFANIKSRFGPNLRVFIAGIAPMVLSMYTSGFGWINLQSRKCIGLFGFTEEGVRMGLGLLDLTPEFSGHLYSRIREYHYGYRFFANSTLTVFNPTRIQFILSKLASACSAGASLAQLEDTLAALPDPNTKPSEATLYMLSSNPHVLDIVMDCINSPRGFLTNFSSVDFQLRPASMVNVEKLDFLGIISWMFFNGALTYSTPERSKLAFIVPNRLARQEDIDEFLKHCAQNAHSSMKKALGSLLDEDDPQPFLEAIESFIFAIAQGHNVKDQEQAFLKISYTCLTLCARDSDHVVSEYSAIPNRPGSKDGKALDLVYISRVGTKKRFGFELKNVPVSTWLEKSSAESFDEQVQVSLSLASESLDDILKLKWNSPKYDLRGKYAGYDTITVGDCISKASLQLKEYLTAMKSKDDTEGPVVGFVVVRVGLHRVVYERVSVA